MGRIFAFSLGVVAGVYLTQTYGSSVPRVSPLIQAGLAKLKAAETAITAPEATAPEQ
jgi:hypothetical protein